MCVCRHIGVYLKFEWLECVDLSQPYIGQMQVVSVDSKHAFITRSLTLAQSTVMKHSFLSMSKDDSKKDIFYFSLKKNLFENVFILLCSTPVHSDTASYSPKAYIVKSARKWQDIMTHCKEKKKLLSQKPKPQRKTNSTILVTLLVWSDE